VSHWFEVCSDDMNVTGSIPATFKDENDACEIKISSSYDPIFMTFDIPKIARGGGLNSDRQIIAPE